MPGIKALRWAVLAAVLSLGGAWGAAYLIRLAPPAEAEAEAGSGGTASSPSLPAAELAARGERFYGLSCSQCHGDDARGDEGPDLHRLSLSNARIAVTIRKGIKGEMPAFGKKYDAEQVAALVAYLRSLR